MKSSCTLRYSFPVLTFLILFQSSNISAAELLARVVRVIDGDTIVVLSEDRTESRVRLAGIDCPEKKGNQPFWRTAKIKLSSIVMRSVVIIDYSKTDRWGRIIGVVNNGEIDINSEMIRVGLCWHYKRYEREQSSSDRQVYSEYEQAAREGSYGLWSDDRAIAPWDWRKGQR